MGPADKAAIGIVALMRGAYVKVTIKGSAGRDIHPGPTVRTHSTSGMAGGVWRHCRHLDPGHRLGPAHHRVHGLKTRVGGLERCFAVFCGVCLGLCSCHVPVRCHPSRHPCDVLYVVPMLIGC